MTSLNTYIWFWCYAKKTSTPRSKLFNVPFPGRVTIFLTSFPHPHPITNAACRTRDWKSLRERGHVSWMKEGGQDRVDWRGRRWGAQKR
jgi:hypothetical protein